MKTLISAAAAFLMAACSTTPQTKTPPLDGINTALLTEGYSYSKDELTIEERMAAEYAVAAAAIALAKNDSRFSNASTIAQVISYFPAMRERILSHEAYKTAFDKIGNQPLSNFRNIPELDSLRF